MGGNDGDNFITITLTDGGQGDDIWWLEDAVIIAQGGPGWPPATLGGGSPGLAIDLRRHRGSTRGRCTGLLPAQDDGSQQAQHRMAQAMVGSLNPGICQLGSGLTTWSRSVRFGWQYKGCSWPSGVRQHRPGTGPDSDIASGSEAPRGRTYYFSVDIFPVAAPSYLLVTPRDSRKLPPELLETISLKCATTSLRTIAEEYGVSYESVRRACLAVERAGGGRPSKSQAMS